VLQVKVKFAYILQDQKIAFHGLRLDYALQVSSNFIAWRDMMEVVLEDNGLMEFIDQEVPKLAGTDLENLADWKKCVA